MSRKKKHEEHENHERWLVSYADFITLLFAFFTVLYATSQTDQKKLEAVVEALNAAFNGGLPSAVFEKSGGTMNSGLQDVPISLVGDTTALVDSMRRGLRGSLSDNVVQVGLVNQTVEVQLPERIAFAAGSADLHPTAYEPLSQVAEIVEPTPAVITVIGHADGVPLKEGSPFVDNWGLAAARAASGVRYLEKLGIPPERLVASATIEADTDAEARAVTLRIDLDQPALGRTIIEALDRKGLLGPPR